MSESVVTRAPLDFRNRRQTAPSRSGVTRCFVYKWIGQRYDTCDDCGRPEREHLYRPTFRGQRPDMHVKVYERWTKTWRWEPVKVLPRGGEVFRQIGTVDDERTTP